MDRARQFWRRTLRGPNATRRVALYQELASLLSAGFGIRQAVANLQAQDRVGVRGVLGIFALQVEQGEPLHLAMASHPEAFAPLETTLMRIGERTGRHVEALRELAERLDAERVLRTQLLSGLAYPLLIAHIALVMPTVPLVLMKHGSGTWLLVVGIGLAVLWIPPLLLVTLYVAFRDRPGFARALERIPVLGSTLRNGALARFAGAFSTLYEAGVDPVETLDEAAGTALLGSIVTDVREHSGPLAAGESFTAALGPCRSLPLDLKQLIASGEESGTLGEALSRAATLYAERAERSGKTLARAVPMIVFLLVAAFVGYLAFSAIGSYFGALEEFL